MHISRLFCSLLLSAACLVPAQAQLFTSSDSKRTAPGQNRTLRYQPDGEDFVIVNGNRKFTRALYGSNTGFRLETSDVPEFALYMPRMGGNLSLGVIVGGKSLWLNDARHIESRYSAGSRIYTITDSLLGKGSIVVTALAMYEADGMILKIEGNKLPSDTRLVWLYGGPNNKRFSREGDMGVDAPDCFDLKPDYCVDNVYRLDDDGNVYMQVLDAGIQDDRFEKGNDVNIRFLRVDLKALMNGENPDPVGNTNPADYITIRFGETTLSSTTQYGTGIQYPMYFLGNECKVNLLIRAKLGFTAETSTVIPYLYTISYNKSK